MEKFAIIVAGGVGKRMQSDVPKQFLLIDGEPIIVKTIKQFVAYDPSINIIVILPEDHLTKWEKIKQAFLPNLSIDEDSGGETRTLSVLAGLNKISGEGLVAVHDAVRPFVSQKSIADSFESAALHGSGVVTVALKDSIRKVIGNKSEARNREDYKIVQTPQTFKVGMLKNSYEKIGEQQFTDDASVFEYAGNPVFLVEGTYGNIKITTPEDLA